MVKTVCGGARKHRLKFLSKSARYTHEIIYEIELGMSDTLKLLGIKGLNEC
jgi:hypothetical protein